MAAGDRMRAERLKAQLRANLRRRKEQARARARLAARQEEGEAADLDPLAASAPDSRSHRAGDRKEQGGDA
ncbi:MAG: hypothetical protein D6740_08825 [Alphaproteobacteria bacterium]|nr:MAG: hypothetical protein D6740_08825 [Alphaproteobacteria bacterium]